MCLCGILDVHMCRVGQNHTFIGMYGVYTVFLAGKPPYIRSYTVQIYGSGQPYTYAQCTNVCLCGIITGKCPCTHTSCMSLYTHTMYASLHGSGQYSTCSLQSARNACMYGFGWPNNHPCHRLDLWQTLLQGRI